MTFDVKVNPLTDFEKSLWFPEDGVSMLLHPPGRETKPRAHCESVS